MHYYIQNIENMYNSMHNKEHALLHSKHKEHALIGLQVEKIVSINAYTKLRTCVNTCTLKNIR